MSPFTTLPIRYRLAAAAGVSILAVAGCSSGSSAVSTGASTTSTGAAAPSSTARSSPATGSGQVLPVSTNPITNTATAKTLSITQLVVENNVDSAGKAAPDHVEIQLKNAGSTALTGFEVYYTETDATTKASESYFTKLPASFSIPAGGSRTIHFDNSGATDHFPVNKFDLYHTSKNALDIAVEVSATGAAPVTRTVHKAAGGAETAD